MARVGCQNKFSVAIAGLELHIHFKGPMQGFDGIRILEVRGLGGTACDFRGS